MNMMSLGFKPTLVSQSKVYLRDSQKTAYFGQEIDEEEPVKPTYAYWLSFLWHWRKDKNLSSNTNAFQRFCNLFLRAEKDGIIPTSVYPNDDDA